VPLADGAHEPGERVWRLVVVQGFDGVLGMVVEFIPFLRAVIEVATGSPAGSARQDNPTISPFSSMSMCSAAGADERPGMVLMSPQMG
jgi:hypothetical protein